MPARVVSLLLSDVVGDDPAVIGSGLTVPSPTDANDAWAVLDQHGMTPPPGIAAFLHAAATHPLYDRPCHGGAPHVLEPSRVGTLVVGGSDAALRGAARRAEELGYTALVVGADLTGDPTAIARMHAQALRAAPHDGLPRAFISGGEAAPIVRGTGRGGPNQECALVLALLLNGMPGWRALVADTDGRDGPTDAAGAMVDGATARAIRAAGLDPAGLLAANDSYTALGAARALLVTGPTGVNVNDLRVVLTRPPSAPRR